MVRESDQTENNQENDEHTASLTDKGTVEPITVPSMDDSLHDEFLESSKDNDRPKPRKEWSDYENQMNEEWQKVLKNEYDEEVQAWDEMYDMMEDRLHDKMVKNAREDTDLSSTPGMSAGMYNVIVTIIVVGAIFVLVITVIVIRRVRYNNAKAYYKRLVDEGEMENEPLCPEGGVSSYLD